MEAEKEWSGDTMDMIDSEARDIGLAENDADGYFKAKEVPNV